VLDEVMNEEDEIAVDDELAIKFSGFCGCGRKMNPDAINAAMKNKMAYTPLMILSYIFPLF
jgi:hypothetical protein